MSYHQNNPLHISIDLINQSTKVDLDPSQLMLIFCIEGHCVVDHDSHLGRDDFMLLSRGEKHPVSCYENTLAVLLSMNYYVLCNYKNRDSLFFFCNSTMESSYRYRELRLLLTSLTQTFVTEGEDSLKFMSDSVALQSYLVDHFVQETSEKDIHTLSKGQRLQMITDYIYVNSTEKISLQKLAKKLYISSSTLSRTFSEMSGESFVSYVRKVRLSRISQELINSEESITNIAINNGFSNASAMSGAFKAQFGLLPSEYRNKYRAGHSASKHRKQLTRQLEQSIKLQPAAAELPNTDSAVHLRFEDTTAQKKWENKIINLGSFRNLNSAKVQEQLLYLKNTLGIEYVRVWNIYLGDLIIQNDAHNKFSFVRLDHIFDFFVENHLKIFLDFSNREELLMANEKKEIYKNKNHLIFESQASWESFMMQFIRHLIQRYGKNVLSEWVFEFEFFLPLKPYYISENYSAIETWDRGYEIIKSELPDALVAGPGLISIQDHALLRQTIRRFFTARHRPDIFTTIHFPYRASEREGDFDSNPMGTFQKISNDIQYLQSGIREIRDILSNMNYTGSHMIVEWNFSISNRSFLQDSCFRASYIIENILKNMEDCDTLALWIATDLSDVFYDSDRILSGSAGLLTIDGICKPSFYAFSFLRQIGKYRLYRNDGLLVTANSDEQFYIICCHSRPLNTKYYLSEETDYGPKDIDTLFNDSEPLTRQIVVENLSDGDTYIVRHQIINHDHGSVLDHWSSLSCSKALSYEDICYLKQISIPEIIIERLTVEHGKLLIHMELQPDEIRAISVTKERPAY